MCSDAVEHAMLLSVLCNPKDDPVRGMHAYCRDLIVSWSLLAITLSIYGLSPLAITQIFSAKCWLAPLWSTNLAITSLSDWY